MADPMALLGLGGVRPFPLSTSKGLMTRSMTARRQHALLPLERDVIYPCRAEARWIAAGSGPNAACWYKSGAGTPQTALETETPSHLLRNHLDLHQVPDR